MKINGKISILIDREKTKIELFDENSRITFATATLTPEQLSSALSRLSLTECSIDVHELQKVGKKLEHKELVFEVRSAYEKSEDAYKIACEIVDDGWIPDSYFGSKNSFFTKDNKHYARCTIRRWV